MPPGVNAYLLDTYTNADLISQNILLPWARVDSAEMVAGVPVGGLLNLT